MQGKLPKPTQQSCKTIHDPGFSLRLNREQGVTREEKVPLRTAFQTPSLVQPLTSPFGWCPLLRGGCLPRVRNGTSPKSHLNAQSASLLLLRTLPSTRHFPATSPLSMPTHLWCCSRRPRPCPNLTIRAHPAAQSSPDFLYPQPGFIALTVISSEDCFMSRRCQ